MISTFTSLPPAGAFLCRTCELERVPAPNRNCYECSAAAVRAWLEGREQRRRKHAEQEAKKHTRSHYAPHRGKK